MAAAPLPIDRLIELIRADPELNVRLAPNGLNIINAWYNSYRVCLCHHACDTTASAPCSTARALTRAPCRDLRTTPWSVRLS